MFVEYPKAKYHATKEPALVNNAEEEVALGDGWENTPAAFLPTEPEPKPKKGK